MQVTSIGKVVINPEGKNLAPNSRTTSYGDPGEFGVIGYTDALFAETRIPGLAGVAGIGNTTGVYGQANSANTNAAGVYGMAMETAGVTFGVLGVTNSSDDGAIGMLGQAAGNDGFTYGVAGETYSGAESSAGVMGISASNSGKTYGVYGQSNGSEDGSSGLVGLANTTDSQFATTGVLGVSRNQGAGSVGVSGIADHLTGERTVGVRGANISEGSFTAGVQGISSGAGADNNTYYGVWGLADKSNTNAIGIGVYGRGSKYGVLGESDGTPGTFSLFGQNNIGTPGFKSFHIDHPLDPANKYLTHICPESPEPLNIYSGNIKTDAQGFATVELPSYFDAINADVRYNLTVVGTFAQAIVIEKAANNRFKIQTDKPNVEVSWMVMGRRNDAFAKKYTLPAETAKEPQNVGKYLTPTLYGQPATKGIFYNPDVEKLQSPKAVYPDPVEPQKPRGQHLRVEDSRK